MDVVDATWAETMPDGDEGSRYFNVGRPLVSSRPDVICTRITVQTDEPGLHCKMRRVCIWSGDKLAVEFPFITAGAVGCKL